jgi:uncharacterized protein
MSRDFPDFIDPWKAAEGQRVFAGTMLLKRMQRLSPLLVSAGGEAGFEISFYFDRQRIAVIKVTVEADLILLCQRSLEPYTETVQRTSFLGVVRDIAEQDMMPSNYEPLVLETGGHETGKLALLDLVEDELLLALPQIPRNPAVTEIELSTDGEVRPLSADKEEPLQRPFAGLAGMLEKS